MNYVDGSAFERDLRDNVSAEYRRFTDDEGLPVHTGLALDGIVGLETAPWDRTGQRGAFVNLYGMEGINDLQVHEIEPGGEIETQRHVHEAIVYVVQGQGATIVDRGEDETFFEWNEGALFYLPPNTPYRYVNLSEEAPAYLAVQTTLPQYITMLKDEGPLFECAYEFGRSTGEVDYSPDGTLYTGATERREEAGHMGANFPVVWAANFIPNVGDFGRLETWQNRGGGGQSVLLSTPDSMCMRAHMSEFPVGRYKKGHRHSPGANIFILAGEGYTLLWREGWDEKVRVEWSAGSVLTPPARWYHQHFNTGSEPARYLAMHPPPLGALEENATFDPHDPENQIEYVDEDPEIREHFSAELEERGLELRMPEACYTDPDFEFDEG